MSHPGEGGRAPIDEPSLTPSQEAGSMASLLGALARTDHPALAKGTIVAEQYRIDRPIGQGGMGVVYLAQDLQLGRDVAVKLCTGVSAAAARRIQREAMALAKLAHPNVVVVFAAGELEQRFFIAMEYVAGGTAADWISGARRSVGEVVSLYAAAGDGLSAAHQAGLIHRDFKPDNVLVGSDGRPRVADFGLVQASSVRESNSVEPSVKDTASATLDGLVVGTLAYMPPEQLAGDVLDARADQFAFAASLWEAIFGQRPTTVTTGTPGAPGALPPLRDGGRLPPRHVVTALRRALSEDRNARWPDMAALLAELRRDPNARRRRLLAVGAAIVMVSTGALAASALAPEDLPQCTDAPAHMAATWNEQRQALLSAAVGDPAWPPIAARVNAHADEWIAQHTAACQATRVDGSASDEALDRRMLCLDGRRRALHAMLSVLEQRTPEAIANAAGTLDLLPAAATCLDADALGLDVLPTDPALRKRIAATQDAVAEAGAASLDPSALDALAKADRAVDQARASGWRPLLAEALAAQAAVLYELGRPADAVVSYEESTHAALTSGDDQLAVQILSDAAWALADLGRLDGADQSLATARALWERTGNSPAAGQRLFGAVAHVALKHRRPEDALAATEQQITLATAAYPGRPSSIATNQYNLAIALSDAGRTREAAVAVDHAIEVARAEFGGDHPTLARYLALAGQIAHKVGEEGRAFDYATEALSIEERWFGATDPRLIVPLQTLGETTRRRGEYQASLAYQTRGLAIRRASQTDAVGIAEMESNLAVTEVEMGHFENAATRATAALATLEKARGTEHPELINILLLTGYIARERPEPDYPASVRDLQRAHALALANLGADNNETVNLEIELGNTFVAMHEAASTIALLEPRLAELDGLELPLHLPAELRLTLARALAMNHQGGRACKLAEEARQEAERLELPPLMQAAQGWLAKNCRR